MAINWGLANNGSFENALATGMALGADIRKRQDEKEYKNALLAFDPERPETLNPIMAANPEVGLKLREDVQKHQTERTTADLTQRAMSGDQEALTQLATVNFDRWSKLDANTKAAAKQEAELFGNAAMDILSRPPAQQAAAVQAYAQQLGAQHPDVMRIAQLPPDQLQSALRSAVANAGMIGKLHEMEQPHYQAVPYESTLVNTSDPKAVAAFQGGGQPAQPGAVAEGTIAANKTTGEQLIFRGGQWVPHTEGGAGASRVGANFLDGPSPVGF